MAQKVLLLPLISIKRLEQSIGPGEHWGPTLLISPTGEGGQPLAVHFLWPWWNSWNSLCWKPDWTTLLRHVFFSFFFLNRILLNQSFLNVCKNLYYIIVSWFGFFGWFYPMGSVTEYDSESTNHIQQQRSNTKHALTFRSYKLRCPAYN